jgi:multiple sugar transport system permease protein
VTVAGVWFYAALLALPIYYIVISASKTNEEIFSFPTALPVKWSWENFGKAWEMAALGDGLVNSGVIVAASLLITLVLSIPAAYSIARSDGRLSRAVEVFFAGGFLIPTFAALVATVLLSIAVGLFQTKLFLILYYPATALPLAVILLTQYMRSIPAELAESAMIDGASRLKVLMLIYLPLSWPAVSSVLVVNFIAFWNEYLFALIIAGPSIETRTAQVALPTLAGLKMTDYGLMSAGTVIILIPVFVFYAILQKRLEGALAAGALKG